MTHSYGLVARNGSVALPNDGRRMARKPKPTTRDGSNVTAGASIGFDRRVVDE